MDQINLDITRRLSRMDAIAEQIDSAIDLFFDDRILAAITLHSRSRARTV